MEFKVGESLLEKGRRQSEFINSRDQIIIDKGRRVKIRKYHKIELNLSQRGQREGGITTDRNQANVKTDVWVSGGQLCGVQYECVGLSFEVFTSHGLGRGRL